MFIVATPNIVCNEHPWGATWNPLEVAMGTPGGQWRRPWRPPGSVGTSPGARLTHAG